MKRNVTMVLSTDTARWLRIEAARRDVSVSQYLGDLVERERRQSERYDEMRARFMGRAPRRLGPAGARLPTRAELHEREGR
jgi:hypothetical protein